MTSEREEVPVERKGLEPIEAPQKKQVTRREFLSGAGALLGVFMPKKLIGEPKKK